MSVRNQDVETRESSLDAGGERMNKEEQKHTIKVRDVAAPAKLYRNKTPRHSAWRDRPVESTLLNKLVEENGCPSRSPHKSL